jgi:pimeloyl-ACP methyl ester carboxylesterase
MDIPIMIVWGKNDKSILLERGLEMHQVLKRSQLEIIDNTGHMPNFEQPDLFNQIVLNFLNSG